MFKFSAMADHLGLMQFNAYWMHVGYLELSATLVFSCNRNLYSSVKIDDGLAESCLLYMLTCSQYSVSVFAHSRLFHLVQKMTPLLSRPNIFLSATCLIFIADCGIIIYKDMQYYRVRVDGTVINQSNSNNKR